MIPEELAARRAFVREMLAEKGKLERALAALDATLLGYSASFAMGHVPAPEPVPEPDDPAPPPPLVALPPPVVEPVEPEPATLEPATLEPAPPIEPGFRTGIEQKRFYPARDDIIVREWPRGTPVKEILEMVHELPGLEVTTNHIGVQATRLGCRRPMKGFAAPHEAARPQVSAMPPLSRMDAMRAVSASLTPRRPMPRAEPVLVNFEQIRRWAGERGMQFLTWEDLPRINAKREDLGQPTFKRDFRK